MRGKFIVIDGGEGTGTTTVSRYVALVYGDRMIRTREPGGSPFAEMIRAVILDPMAKEADAETLFALFWAARRDHVMRVIKPTLEKGKHVLCDRFHSSTWAYQIKAGGNHHLVPLFMAHCQYFLKDVLCMPDYHIILDGDPRICLLRAKKRAQVMGEVPTHFDDRELAYHNAVREGFLDFVKDKPHVIIDAEDGEDIVKQNVVAAVRTVVE